MIKMLAPRIVVSQKWDVSMNPNKKAQRVAVNYAQRPPAKLACAPPDDPLHCDDQNACTNNGCEPERGCVYPPKPEGFFRLKEPRAAALLLREMSDNPGP